VTEGIIQFKSYPAGNLKIPRDVVDSACGFFFWKKSSHALSQHSHCNSHLGVPL